MPLRFRRTAAAFTLIVALGSLSAVASTVAAHADEPAPSSAPTVPASATPDASATAAGTAAAREDPTLKLEYIGQSRYGLAQFQVTITPMIFPDPRSDYPELRLQIDGQRPYATDGFGDEGDGPIAIELKTGHYTARAITSENARFNAAVSPTIEFDVSGPKVTKLTLIPPKNPVGHVKYPYTVKVAPSAGSTARVNLSQYDNTGRLEYIGFGYLKDGQVTINAAAWPGQRRIVAEFTGDDTYAVSGTAVDIFFPAGPTAVADPPAAPVPSETAAAAAPSQSARPVAATDPAAAATGELAYTGSNPWPGVGLSGLLLAAGFTIVLARRRRRV